MAFLTSARLANRIRISRKIAKLRLHESTKPQELLEAAIALHENSQGIIRINVGGLKNEVAPPPF